MGNEDDFSTHTVTQVINEIYDSGEITEELSRSIFVGINKCGVQTIRCVIFF